MRDIYEILKEKGISLPAPPPDGGVYRPVKAFGKDDKLLYCSGCGPDYNGVDINGKLGSDLSLEQGRAAARNCALNLLSVLDRHTGDLNRIKRFVKILAFVNSASDFYQQPQVVNGASELLLEIFGEEAGLPARSAIGTNTLPENIAVEIEALVELH